MQNKNLVVIWSDDYPFKHTAFNEKNSLLAKALILAGYDVTLTSLSSCDKEMTTVSGINDNIHWCNFDQKHIKFKPFRFFRAVLSEMRFILSLRKRYNKIYLISSYYPFPVFIFYYLFCKIYHIKLVLNIMEWHIDAYKYSLITKRIDAFLFDKFAVRLSKGTIAISELILSNLKRISSHSKYLLVPALTDLQKIDKVSLKNLYNFPYVLYCGGIGYLEVIELIIDGFEEYCISEANNNIHLILILHGKKCQLEMLQKKITTKSFASQVHILSDLDYNDLITHYKSASALLVPLRNTIQDKARYPQKIAEYAACARPIISNQIGQVERDFKHKLEIYFMKSYSTKGLSTALKEVLSNTELAQIISCNARKKAESYFNYQIYSNIIDNFFKSF